jgi:methionyl-tRNA formyltransferase
MRIVVIGGVSSTLMLIEKLNQHGFRDVHIFGYSPSDLGNVSGWANLSSAAANSKYSYNAFNRVSECRNKILEIFPDIVFAVGLSQIIPNDILTIPRLGCVGFHPTALPAGRGRAPIAWLILKNTDGAATFFSMRPGVDDGPILVQEPFKVDSQDTAGSVEAKMLLAESEALDRWLPQLAIGSFVTKDQDHRLASWYGRRTPDDGWINWHDSAHSIDRLIRATTKPFPGAYTFHQEHKIIIWSAVILEGTQEFGVIGRILRINDSGGFLVQCNEEKTLLVTEWETESCWQQKVGMKLGYYQELEIQSLRLEMSRLNEKISILMSNQA